jgi:LPXTG-motif cell wall-anchored protein
MRRIPTPIALSLAASALLSATMLATPAPEAGAQTPKPTAPAPTAKPAGAATAPRAGGIPLELAGALVAGGSALAGGGLYALRRRKRQA